ncbi:MAG TPA: FecR family protein [Rhodothermales bacterium]|nr:FecR family protein [Rhodothermales bacterium]
MSDRPTPPEMPPFEGAASDDLVEILLATEALAPDELEALRALVRSDADRNARARTLGATEERLHAELEAALPDRSLLVLLALDTAGRRDLLDEADFARLEHARPALDDVLTSFPGLRLVLLRIAGDAAVFEACWAEEERIEDRARVDRPAQPHARTLRPLWRIGVGLAVVAFAAVSVVLLRRDQGLVTVTARAPETVALGDGTSIRLTRGAVLRYARPNRSGAEARRVRLSGDAYFDVAPGEAPFQVQTPTARVSVLGTVFGVRATMAETEVTLVEGALTVQAGGRWCGCPRVSRAVWCAGQHRRARHLSR